MISSLLGIDYGSVRVGLALYSGEGNSAQPYKTLNAGPSLTSEIISTIAQQSIREIVVGLPRNLDGGETSQTALVRQFALDLAKHTQLPVHLQDEALTSQEAESRLKPSYPAGIPVGLIDQYAAAIILQDYVGGL